MAGVGRIRLSDFGGDQWRGAIEIDEEWNFPECRSGCQARVSLTVEYLEGVDRSALQRVGPIDMTVDETKTLIDALQMVLASIERNDKPFPSSNDQDM